MNGSCQTYWMSTASENIDLEDLSFDSLTDLVPRTDIVQLSDQNNSVLVVDNSQTENNQVPDDQNNSVLVVDNSQTEEN